jgi:hypothetical protein
VSSIYSLSAHPLTRCAGPTSTAQLLHPLPSVSSWVYESYNLHHHLQWGISRSGDGFLYVEKPPNEEQKDTLTKPLDLRIECGVIEKFVNALFINDPPPLPVVTAAAITDTTPSYYHDIFVLCAVHSTPIVPPLFSHLLEASLAPTTAVSVAHGPLDKGTLFGIVDNKWCVVHHCLLRLNTY